MRTWILIADGARARLFVNEGPGSGLMPAIDEDLIWDNRPSREIASDRSGQTFDSGGQGRHGMEPPTDPHRHEQRAFTQKVARLLEDNRKQDSFDRLIIVAPPKALGDLREALSVGVSERVTGELSKDLTKVPVHSLSGHLSDLIGL